MIKVHGEFYYIDFKVLDDFLLIEDKNSNNIQTTKETIREYNEDMKLYNTKEIEKEHIKHKEINGVRYDLISRFIEDLVLSYDDDGETDPMLGSNNLEKLSNRFKLTFNTLVNYNILKKK